MGEQGHIFQINISGGGVPKTAIQRGEVTALGLVGDVQRDKRYHGGPTRALCLYPLELILQLQSEGHPIYPGSVGENITTVGLEFSTLRVGDRLSLGAVLIEVTDYAAPCATIKGSFKDGKYTRISVKTHPGESRLYARVLQIGSLSIGDEIGV
ncbi:MAG TPA: MOSC domain-containing protein, partial [Herpetosiphonaceae bacterium]|nr:MOSC domain-containing protein [Herpetosiphonaceae bacterium]